MFRHNNHFRWAKEAALYKLYEWKKQINDRIDDFTCLQHFSSIILLEILWLC